ncbi:hypothetical protein KR200_000361 [Drosophila serrata]|nr:hypothetical protein KR200_000361 [Drosophila serrata]
MVEQYVNSGYSRAIMSLLRCWWTSLYLWVMMHAGGTLFVVNESWNEGFLWNLRKPDKLFFFDPLSVDTFGEVWTVVMIAAVLGGVYRTCGCRLVGSGTLGRIGRKPRLQNLWFCAPYIGAIGGCWIFSTFLLARHMFTRELSHTSMNLYAKLIFALLFKILVMANMTSVFLRAYVKVMELAMNWNRGQTSDLNFGERLRLILHN